MSDFTFRPATLNDIPFLADAIIEAEKSGTDILTYSTVFGITEAEAKNYIIEMLNEEVDGCELSVSSFLLAEKNGTLAAAFSAWVEGSEGIASSMIKGNLLNFCLPKKCIDYAIRINPIIHELHIDCTWNSIQIGAGYVVKEFRGNALLGIIYNKMINQITKLKPDASLVCAQIFACNTPSIKTFETANYKIELTRESTNRDILKYLPFHKKVLMTKEINH